MRLALICATDVRNRLHNLEQRCRNPDPEGHKATGFYDLPAPGLPLALVKKDRKPDQIEEWAFSTSPERALLMELHLIQLFSFPSFSIKDKSNPEDQSSWDSFKNMTPELSIVPGEQKDRMELHNKNWDSSSANTPDSSEGDFQTEV